MVKSIQPAGVTRPALFPEVLPAKTRRPADPAVRAARIIAREQEKAREHELLLNLITNPVALWALGSTANVMAYKSGMYKQLPELSALGGPVWFTVGRGLPVDQDYFAKNQAMINSIAMAMALSPIAKSGLQFAGTTIKDLGPAAMALMK